MSKLTMGVVAGITLAVAAAVPSLASSGSPGAVASPVTAATPAAAKVASAASAKMSAKSVTPPAAAAKKLAALVAALRVPAPAKQVPSPLPGSDACKAAPQTPYCDPDSVRYLTTLTTLKARAVWLPVATKWGMKVAQDTCIKQPKTAGQMCVVQGTKGSQAVTLLFKAYYTGQYAPDQVEAKTTAINADALKAASAATSSDAKLKIMKAAKAKIAALEKAAAAWNTAHPQATVNVVLS
jgi:hypothetical protein